MSNLSRCIRHHALRTPTRQAMSYDGQTVTYGAMWRRVLTVAGLLRDRGVGSGDRVALLMKNSPAFLEIAFAASHVGAVLVPINFRLSPEEVAYILADSGTTLLFRDEELGGWEAAVPTIALDAAAQADASQLPGCRPDPALTDREPGDLLRIMYTSGTTDHPKGVMHSYANFYAKSADHVVALGLTAATRLLITGPLYHVGAFDLPGIAVLWAGGVLCIKREFDAADALALIAGERLTGAWLAPVMTSAILAEQAARPVATGALEWVIGGGERTPEARIRAFAEAFPGARYIDAYGLTETCGGDTLMEPGREIERIGSVGRPLSQVDIEIRDDAGGVLGPNVEGEVCIRGPKVTAGYWNAPKKTAASFFGSWLRSGDVGYLDDEGFLYLTDRKKDLIISGGENIASSEVERVILEMAEVADVAVIAIPDPRWGERPLAFVVPQAGVALTEEYVQQHCRGHLAGFKIPDRVILVDTLPRTASGKVLKRTLRERARHGA